MVRTMIICQIIFHFLHNHCGWISSFFESVEPFIYKLQICFLIKIKPLNNVYWNKNMCATRRNSVVKGNHRACQNKTFLRHNALSHREIIMETRKNSKSRQINTKRSSASLRAFSLFLSFFMYCYFCFARIVWDIP